MQYQDQIVANNLAARIYSGMTSALEGAVARYKHHRVYRRTLAELRTLSDRDLTDLGLGTADLRTIARKAADMTVQL